MGRIARIEIDEEAPLKGRIQVGHGEAVEFRGWGELRYHLLGAPSGPKDSLTDQELRIASLACEGLSNTDIATALVLSPRTVQWHLNKAFKKLAVRSRTELAVMWLTSDR